MHLTMVLASNVHIHEHELLKNQLSTRLKMKEITNSNIWAWLFFKDKVFYQGWTLSITTKIKSTWKSNGILSSMCCHTILYCSDCSFCTLSTCKVSKHICVRICSTKVYVYRCTHACTHNHAHTHTPSVLQPRDPPVGGGGGGVNLFYICG